jgi:hypothetical protein
VINWAYRARILTWVILIGICSGKQLIVVCLGSPTTLGYPHIEDKIMPDLFSKFDQDFAKMFGSKTGENNQSSKFQDKPQSDTREEVRYGLTKGDHDQIPERR